MAHASSLVQKEAPNSAMNVKSFTPVMVNENVIFTSDSKEVKIAKS